MLRPAVDRALLLELALATALAVSACATTHVHRTPDELRSDEDLANRVRETLREDPLLYDAHVAVSAEGGVVRLTGVLSEADDFYEVRRVVRAIPGVTRVASDLQLVDRR